MLARKATKLLTAPGLSLTAPSRPHHSISHCAARPRNPTGSSSLRTCEKRCVQARRPCHDFENARAWAN
eukprot:218000-Alexandrium_andersonii.AAC.1